MADRACRVVWYAYEGDCEAYVTFVKRLIAHLDVLDEIQCVSLARVCHRHTLRSIVKRFLHPFPYWDQPLYYNHCGEIYRTASDYFIIVDLDEQLALAPEEIGRAHV